MAQKLLSTNIERVNARSAAAWALGFGSFFVWAVWYGRSIQMKNSPLFKGVMFTLRNDAQVKRWIGTNIQPSVHINGFVNHIKSHADMQFEITGTMGKGNVKLEAVRVGEDWFVKTLIVICAGEEIVHIKDNLQQQ